MRAWHIYALTDPHSKEIRYVGWSVDVRQRLYRHCQDAKNGGRTHRAAWLRSLLAAGSKPLCDILETGSGDGWVEAERRWIKGLRELGCPLTNHADGGEGAPGYHKLHSAETREKISKAHQQPHIQAAKSAFMRSRPIRPETKQKLREIMRSRPPEAWDALRKCNIGRKYSPERVEKTAAKLRGRKIPSEIIEKRASKLRGRKQSPDHTKRSADSRRGAKRTGEALRNVQEANRRKDHAAIADKNRGAKRSEEAKARMRAAWARKRGQV